MVPLVPMGLALLVVLVALVGFRVGLNVVDSNVIDVGYAGVIGADRIADGDPLYGAGFSHDVERGDTYGPLTYLAYVPFEQAMPWSGGWDDLPAAHGAAIAFDLLTLLGLVLLGRRLHPGAEGRSLGMALAYAWAAYPYTAFALETNSNDSLVAMLTVLALLGLTVARPGASALARGAAIGLAAGGEVRPAGAGAAVRNGWLAIGAFARELSSPVAVSSALLGLALAVAAVRARRRPARAL